MNGVDVSTFQGYVNWRELKDKGKEFAIIKATQGHSASGTFYLFVDSQFKNNLRNATNAGFKCGVYHFLTAANESEAVQEATFFIKTILPYKGMIDLWAAVDIEDLPKNTRLPKDKTALTNIVNAFCNTVKASRFKPMIYTNPNFLRYRMYDTNWDLWLALWRDKNCPPTISEYPNMKIWQYGQETVGGRQCGQTIQSSEYKPEITGGKLFDCDIMFETKPPDYATAVCEKCGLEQQTKDYLNKYKYAPDLWRKLWSGMEQ